MNPSKQNKLRIAIKNNNKEKLTEIFLEELGIFLQDCENIYSRILITNPNIDELVSQLIVPYYQDNFTKNKSREISFLPTELRLFIYISIIRNSNNFMCVVHCLDRICVTLSKMRRNALLEDAVVLYTACEFLLKEELHSNVYGRYNSIILVSNNFNKNIKFNQNAFRQVQDLKKAGLKEALLDVDILLYQEFWYGIKAFSCAEIYDMQMAMYCLKLFEIYFDKVVDFTSEFTKAFEDFYLNNDRRKLDKLLKTHELDQIDLSFKVSKIDIK